MLLVCSGIVNIACVYWGQKSANLGTIGEKSSLPFFIDKPCSILSKCRYIYCLETLFNHLYFTPYFQIVTLNFLTFFTQKLVILNEISQNLMKNSMINSQIV